jgi:hypothetical protein
MAIAFVNAPTVFEDDGGDHSSGATGTFTATAGNTIIVAVWWVNNATNSLTSVTDTAGNSYTLIGTKLLNSVTGKYMQWAYVTNCLGNASNAVTANLNVSARITVIAVQYSGLATSSVLDQTASGKDEAGGSATLTSAAFTTTQADELILEWGHAIGSVPTAGAGYTSRVATVRTRLAEQIVSTVQTGATATQTLGGADNWSILVATFKMAGGGAPSLVQLERRVDRGSFRGQY